MILSNMFKPKKTDSVEKPSAAVILQQYLEFFPDDSPITAAALEVLQQGLDNQFITPDQCKLNFFNILPNFMSFPDDITYLPPLLKQRYGDNDSILTLCMYLIHICVISSSNEGPRTMYQAYQALSDALTLPHSQATGQQILHIMSICLNASRDIMYYYTRDIEAFDDEDFYACLNDSLSCLQGFKNAKVLTTTKDGAFCLSRDTYDVQNLKNNLDENIFQINDNAERRIQRLFRQEYQPDEPVKDIEEVAQASTTKVKGRDSSFALFQLKQNKTGKNAKSKNANLEFNACEVIAQPDSAVVTFIPRYHKNHPIRGTETHGED